MRWRGRRQSTNVEDRRGRRVSRRAGAGIGGVGAIVIALVAAYFGIDPAIVMEGLDAAGGKTGHVSAQNSSYQPTAEEKTLGQFVAVVLADTEDIWHRVFQAHQREYQEPKLVLFSDAVQSACGTGKSAMGPFYCPGDQKIYIDLGFYRELRRRHGAPGDFAQAYVIAHEVGHHVQTLLGISKQVHAKRRTVSQEAGNRLSVKQELQADCFAGLWAHHAERAKQILEKGDVAEALGAASSIGDDRLQRQSRGYITPESFTHGTSKQRVHWFRRGLDSGQISECNTFKVQSL